MYLETDCRCAVLARLVSLLAPDGVVIPDPDEHVGRAGHLFMPGADGVYSRRRTPSTAQRQTQVKSCR